MHQPAASFGVLPPSGRRRWRWQIGLRGLAIGVTLLCLGLAWWVNSAERQKRAVAKLAGHGVYVVRDFGGTSAKNRTKSALIKPGQDMWPGVDYWYPVVEVYSHHENYTYHPEQLTPCQEILAAVRELPHVQSLRFSGLPATNDDLYPLTQLKELKSLGLGSSQIKEGHCDAFREMQLEVLYLERTRFDDRGLACLKHMQNLRHLDLTRTKVTDAGLVYLEQLPKQNSLRLNRSLVTKAGYEALQRKLPGCTIRWEPLKANPQ